MNKRNSKRLSMLQYVLLLASQNAPIVNLVIAFKTGITGLTGIVNQALALLGSQSQSVAGGGTQKQQERNILNQLTYAIINAARGYFLSVGNVNTAQELKKSLSQIQRIADTVIAERAEYWFGIVNAEIANLSDWGITPESMVSWNNQIDAYKNVETLPTSKRELKKSRTAQVKTLIKQGIQLCKDTLDTSALSFIEMGPTQKQFYMDYKSGRIIHDDLTKHTKLIVSVTDELNQPIYDCQILQDGTDNKISTGINGDATLYIKTKTGKKPVYSFTISKGSSIVTSGPIQISKGETVHRAYIMQPSGFIIPAPVDENTNVPA